nr:uncharacterized protein LOC111850022 [Paramormyrops kingsleyae]XP_023679195.1 uncharacterized protein LOC111850022 [Paramormyrops kingsleyae]
MKDSKGFYTMQSFLLDCRRFTGKHCGERIASAFEEIVEEYGIRLKVSFIITDNASNMKRAFKVSIPQDSEHPDSEGEDLDDEMMWEDIDAFESASPCSSSERLSCFAHSLQLVVNDGMKELKAVSRAIAKASKITSLVHSSSQYRDKFEACFGTNRSIPAANTTRWNSTFKKIQALTALEHKALTEMCSDSDNLVFSAREWTQLKELCAILALFSEATDMTEGGKSVTISMVVPTVLDLKTHLIKMENRMQTSAIARALRMSLENRFSGIFGRINMEEGDIDEPFNHRVYFLATILDPQFGLSWVDLDVNNGESGASLKRFRD